jgi:hypothetical protein
MKLLRRPPFWGKQNSGKRSGITAD